MAKGSNDLNMLLKARVVKIKAELDVKGSMPRIRQQVDMITRNLDNKPVKLRVKLDYKIGQLRQQVGKISQQLSAGKRFNSIKLRAELDMKGSTAQINSQLGKVDKSMDKFSKSFKKNAKEVETSKRQMDKALSTNIPTKTAGVQNFNNIKQYTNQLKEAERILRSKFHDGKGLFQSKEIKDANGNLHQFVGSLQRANGVMEQIRYGWSANKGQFEIMDRQTTTQTQRNLKQAQDSLARLGNEMKVLGQDSNKLNSEYRQLLVSSRKGTLTNDSIKNFREMLNGHKADLEVQRSIAREEERRKKILREIATFRKNTGLRVGDDEIRQARALRQEVSRMSVTEMRSTKGSKRIAEIEGELKLLKQVHSLERSRERERASILSKRKSILSEIRDIELKSPTGGTGAMSKRYVEETRQLARTISSMREYEAVRARMDNIKSSRREIETNSKIGRSLDSLKTKMMQYGQITGRTTREIERDYARVEKRAMGNLSNIQKALSDYTSKIARFNASQKLLASEGSIAQGVDSRRMQSLVNERDISGLKEYIGQVNKAKVATLSLTQAKSGNFTVSTQFESAGKSARRLVQELSSVDNKVRTVSDGMVYNANRNLGVFEQLGIAMKRVPVWMGAMTVFYGSIRSVRAMTNEVLELDRAMTEFRRVASDGLNLESVFEGSMQMAKELGNNVHEVLQAMNDYARTYGEFNERQLLAITNTAVLMSNVSELNAQEATESLIGTMNAFNITAEDSIRIVDALNEVDNNYAVSTQQLATGLQKSASVAETFGRMMPTYTAMCNV